MLILAMLRKVFVSRFSISFHEVLPFASKRDFIDTEFAHALQSVWQHFKYLYSQNCNSVSSGLSNRRRNIILAKHSFASADNGIGSQPC